MSDKTFERSLTGLTVLIVLWMVLGSIFGIMAIWAAILTGIVVELVGGGFLLHYWGKSYMERQ
jgi:5-bromo-4-chloroindolyl phosphate hydrolysis protein